MCCYATPTFFSLLVMLIYLACSSVTQASHWMLGCCTIYMRHTTLQRSSAEVYITSEHLMHFGFTDHLQRCEKEDRKDNLSLKLESH